MSSHYLSVPYSDLFPLYQYLSSIIQAPGSSFLYSIFPPSTTSIIHSQFQVLKANSSLIHVYNLDYLFTLDLYAQFEITSYMSQWTLAHSKPNHDIFCMHPFLLQPTANFRYGHPHSHRRPETLVFDPFWYHLSLASHVYPISRSYIHPESIYLPPFPLVPKLKSS